METTARRVKAERDRQRLPHRSGMERWTLRVVFVLATAAFLGVGVASALMILPDDEANKGPAVYSAPTAVPAPAKVNAGQDQANQPKGPTQAQSAPTAVPAHAKVKAGKHKSTRPKGPTKAQRAQRTAAVAELRRQGFTALHLSSYDYKATLRVLIGRPVGDAAGGSYAFFFVKDRYLGKDSTTPSNKVSVAKTGKSQVTLSYETSAGRAKVRFKLDGETLQPLDEIPPAGERYVRKVT